MTNMMTANELTSKKSAPILDGVYPALVNSYTVVSEKLDDKGTIISSAHIEVNLYLEYAPKPNQRILKYTTRITPNNIDYILPYLELQFATHKNEDRPNILELLELGKTNKFSVKFYTSNKQLRMSWQDEYYNPIPDFDD